MVKAGTRQRAAVEFGCGLQYAFHQVQAGGGIGRIKRKLAAATLVVAGTLTLAACGGGMDGMNMGDDSSSSPSATADASAEFNDADVTFASHMIPHHQQAVEMAELADTRAQSQEVKDLAAQIKRAQGPEIEQMTAWLDAWGQPAPSDMGGMDMGGSMPGMMSEDEMGQLEGASGAEFDQMFLTMMISHHQGAIEMAKTEQADGKNEDAIDLAAQIERAQTEEIATMRELLK
ncbi:DUF305 domain-containing protein [Nocardioides aquiterrae]|uniref:DUF305 domain-containing protein n=1 Tax=Nocardioides aquiterrae TaxID=203799 RepID=A0ABN1U959_9ACTN